MVYLTSHLYNGYGVILFWNFNSSDKVKKSLGKE